VFVTESCTTFVCTIRANSISEIRFREMLRCLSYN